MNNHTKFHPKRTKTIFSGTVWHCCDLEWPRSLKLVWTGNAQWAVQYHHAKFLTKIATFNSSTGRILNRQPADHYVDWHYFRRVGNSQNKRKQRMIHANLRPPHQESNTLKRTARSKKTRKCTSKQSQLLGTSSQGFIPRWSVQHRRVKDGMLTANFTHVRWQWTSLRRPSLCPECG